MKRTTLLWLVPILVTIHDLEEAIFMPSFIEKRNASIPASLRSVVPQLTYRQFLLAIIIVTLIPYLVLVLGRGSKTAVYLIVCFQVVIFINVFAHCLMSLSARGYTPGLVTALLINLPFSVVFLRRAYVEHWFSKSALALTFPLSLLIHGPLLAGLMFLAGEIVGRP